MLDITQALQNAIDSVGSAGGGDCVFAGQGLISSNVTVRAGVTLKGVNPTKGGVNRDSAGSVNPATMPTAFTVSTAINGPAFITEQNSAIRRVAMVAQNFPFQYTATPTFAGVACGNLASSATPLFDVLVEDSQFYGFVTAVRTDWLSRVNVNRCNMECIEAVEISNAYDVCKISECEAWPFMAAGSLSGSSILKNGTAFFLHDNNSSWHVIEDCFAYGWATAFGLENTGNDRLINCGADGPGGVTATGISIYGRSYGAALVTGFQSAVSTGINSNATTADWGVTAQVTNAQFWGNVQNPFNVQANNTVKGYNVFWTGGSNVVGSGSTLTLV